MSTTEDIATTPILEISGSLATIRFNRPRHLNRLQPEDLQEVMQHFDAIEANPSIRVMVLTGTGRAFSAGFDLGEMANRVGGQAPPGSTGSLSFETVANRLEDLALPTICRLNGGVYGGSTDLALACDFRVGAENCEMVMPAGRLGLHYYRGGIKRYVTRLGVNHAKRLFLTAEKIGAQEMFDIGYLTSLATLDSLDLEVATLVKNLAGNAPLALRGMKRAINEFARGELDEADLDRRNVESMRGDEIREGIAAYKEKRAPRFP